MEEEKSSKIAAVEELGNGGFGCGFIIIAMGIAMTMIMWAWAGFSGLQ